MKVAEMGKAEFLRRYPTADYEANVETERMISAYYSQPSEVLNAHFSAQHEDNKAKGWNND